MKTIVICGAGGFIGSHLSTCLSAEGCRVIGLGRRPPEFGFGDFHDFVCCDLVDPTAALRAIPQQTSDVYQLAADMGGTGYTFSGLNDARIMANSVRINANVASACAARGVKRVLFASSVCVYPGDSPTCIEGTEYPAMPHSDYGWEKLFSERLWLAHRRNFGLDVRIARLQTIFGPGDTYEGGRDKAISAICRKVALTEEGGQIEVWGDGTQIRTFLYIDQCVEGLSRIMNAEPSLPPLNLGSDEPVSISALTEHVIRISGKRLRIKYIPGVTGPRIRLGSNRQIELALGWSPRSNMKEGLEITYHWIRTQYENASSGHGGN